jgi:hypothetical protein
VLAVVDLVGQRQEWPPIGCEMRWADGDVRASREWGAVDRGGRGDHQLAGVVDDAQ